MGDEQIGYSCGVHGLRSDPSTQCRSSLPRVGLTGSAATRPPHPVATPPGRCPAPRCSPHPFVTRPRANTWAGVFVWGGRVAQRPVNPMPVVTAQGGGTPPVSRAGVFSWGAPPVYENTNGWVFLWGERGASLPADQRPQNSQNEQSARISACIENAGAEGFSNGPNPVDPTRPATSHPAIQPSSHPAPS